VIFRRLRTPGPSGTSVARSFGDRRNPHLEEVIGFLNGNITWRDLSHEGKQVAEGFDRDGGSSLDVRDGEVVLLS
jgi:hypothetical protein